MITAPDLLASLPADDTAIVIAVVVARLLLPLAIPRFPLIIVAAMVLDAADQTILQNFTDVDTTEAGPYQGVDKALDIYYLSIAYLSTMRNWTSDSAFRISQFLFFYRLVGVTLFELMDSRALLLVFPNTFEYFFIFYELVRVRRDPARISVRFWLISAIAIWVFIKLPQEYWIHVAKLDTTDLIGAHPVLGVVAGVAALALLGFFLVFVWPRLPAPDWALRIAADPLPTSLDDARRQHADAVRSRRFFSAELFEKALGLLALICIVFAEILPAVEATPLQIAIGVTAIVSANTAVSVWFARREGSRLEAGALSFASRLALNVVFVFLATVILRGDSSFHLGYGIFFAYLITLIIWLYDFYRPVYDVRFESSPPKVGSLGDFVARARARTS